MSERRNLTTALGPVLCGPDGVNTVRSLVLNLAVSGRLSRRAHHDEASELLSAVEKARNSDHKLRASDAPACRPVEPDERPFDSPEGWVWTRLGYVFDFINGRAFKPTEWAPEGLPIIRIQNVTDPTAPVNRFAGQLDERHRIRSGDLLLSWSATIRADIWRSGDAALNQHIFKVVPVADALSVEFGHIALSSLLGSMREHSHGSAMQHITKAKLIPMPICVPPKSEQDRIVKSVHDVMALLDEFEAALAEEQALAVALGESVVDALRF